MKRRLIQNSGKVKGFTLSELLVVLIILGILVLLALPNLLPLISRAKSTEAKLQLRHLHLLQKTYYMEHSEYADALGELDFEPPKTIEQDGRGLYRYEILSADLDGFKAKATAVQDFDGDGQFNQWEIDQDGNLKEIVKD